MVDLKNTEKKELKKVAKAIEFGVDIKKLEREIVSLESKKVSAINELEEMKTTVNKSILEDRKLIVKERETFESEVSSRKGELDGLEKKVENRNKQVTKKEDEFENLKVQIAEHNDAVLELILEKKEVENTRVDSLEKQHKADLIIEQYEKKLKELDDARKEVDSKLEELNSQAE